ncbi:uncharacterized protein TNCV_3034211 [Trichonephila clavipes]|nr:uncharacterized protein TNCV_3034211 [Trichonephila clavipes]
MSEKALVDPIFVRLEPQVQDYVEVRNTENTVQLLEVLAKFEERYSCKKIRGSRNSDNVEGRGWNKRRMSDVGVTTRIAVKEISGSRAGIYFRRMIDDLTIGVINLETVKKTILVDGITEIGARVKILVEALKAKGTIECFES